MLHFKLPDVGEGLHEAEIVRWLVRPGDVVTQDQPMVEIQTDKALVEISAPQPGRIVELRVAEGNVTPVGTVIIVIEPSGATPRVALSAPEPFQSGTGQVAPSDRENAPARRVVARAGAALLQRPAEGCRRQDLFGYTCRKGRHSRCRCPIPCR